MKKTKKAYEIVIDSIKEQIMNQELVLGQGLPPEREISEKLGVSRNSVREALKILTVMGVVSSRQGAGNYISGNFKGYMVDALSMMFMLDKLDYDQINQIRIGHAGICTCSEECRDKRHHRITRICECIRSEYR